MEHILEEAKNLQASLVAHRRWLHEHAEVAFDLVQTKEYVREQLTQMGYTPVDCGRAGLIVTVGSKKKGKTFLLRADMDALPIPEESGVEFSCKTGAMHACGHDMHTAMLLGAAKLLKAHEEEISGTVKLMFQPAEEIFEGSQDMIEAGLLENPKVDAALMMHVMAGMPFPAGTVVVSAAGVSAPAADYFEIRVKGKGCHGAMPNTGIDPVTAAAHIVIGLQEIGARELALSDKAVLTIGTIQGGEAANVIPDMVVLGGSLRTYEEATRAYIKERLENIATGIAGSFRAEAEVVFGSGCPTLLNDKELAQCTAKYMKELFGDKKAFTVEELSAMGGGQASKSAGSEDFAYVSQEVPSIMLALAAGEQSKGYIYPQHHPKVMFDEEALKNGSAAYAYAAMRFLEEHS